MLDRVALPSDFKHDVVRIKTLYTTKGDSVVAKEDFYIMFPERYINKNLAIMGGVVKLISIYAIISKDMKYGIVNSPVFVEVLPNNVTSVIIDGVVYKLLEIQKGSSFILNRNVIKDSGFMYDIFDEFFLQGKVPWYLTYDELSNIFAEASKYANSDIGKDPLAIEIITAIISRSDKDKRLTYRNIIKSKKDKSKLAYAGLNDVFYSYDNTLSKIMGGYMQVGVTVAVVNKEETTTKVSDLLRK